MKIIILSKNTIVENLLIKRNSKLIEINNIKHFKYEILKIGRKWLEARDVEKKYINSIEINDISKDWKVGDIVEFDGTQEFKTSSYGTKVFVYPINKEESTKDKDIEELERWLDYIENAAFGSTPYLYKNGYDKVQKLHIEEYPEYMQRLEKALNNIEKHQIIKWLSYVEEAAYSKTPYLYKNGIDTLKSLNIEKYPELYKQLQNAIDSVKSYVEIKKDKKDKRDFFPLSDAPIINKVYQNNDTYIVYTEMGKSFYIDENMPSIFGSRLLGHEGEKGAYYYYREATPEEMALYKNEQEEHDRKKKFHNEVLHFIEYVIQHGVKPSNKISFPEGIEVLNTMNMYGGGECFVINEEDNKIWYIKNNGADGDNWEYNNIKTTGAGAIGWYIPYNKKDATLLLNN